MRLMHVITGLNTGGAETALCRLLESLHTPDFVHIIVALGSEGALSARVRASGARLTHLGMNPRRPSPRALLKLRQLLSAERPDLVHGWMYHANLAATLAASGKSIPVVWGIRQSLYDLNKEKYRTRMVIRIGAWLSNRPSQILYNSVTSARQHEAFGFAAAKTGIIPNGFDTGLFRADAQRCRNVRTELNIPPDAFVIGLIARLHPMKDHDNFLRAAVLFAKDHPQAIFVVVGDGLDMDNAAFVTRIRQLGLIGRVRLCGRRGDIAAINAALDVASSSSSWGEAFPNAIGEAMACGVPVVATDVGDVGDIVGNTGIVVPPRDSEALCAGWTRLAAMTAEARLSLGRKARERILTHYALPAVADQYAERYREYRGREPCAA